MFKATVPITAFSLFVIGIIGLDNIFEHPAPVVFLSIAWAVVLFISSFIAYDELEKMDKK